MEKKTYLQPLQTTCSAKFKMPLYQMTASEEGIGSGGPGSGDDDPDAKKRDDLSDSGGWGNLW